MSLTLAAINITSTSLVDMSLTQPISPPSSPAPSSHPLPSSTPVVGRCTRSMSRRLHLASSSASPSPIPAPRGVKRQRSPGSDSEDAASKRPCTRSVSRVLYSLSPALPRVSSKRFSSCPLPDEPPSRRRRVGVVGLAAVEAELCKVGLPAQRDQRAMPGPAVGKRRRAVLGVSETTVSGGRRALVQDVLGDGACQTYAVLHQAFGLSPSHASTQAVGLRFRQLVAERLRSVDDELKVVQAGELREVYPAAARGKSDVQLYDWYVSGFVSGQLWGGNLTLVAMAGLLGSKINVVQRAAPDCLIDDPASSAMASTLNIFLNVQHYMSVVQLE